MDIKEYIESGILELYVAGHLSEKENEKINKLIQQYPELLQEVLEIEEAVLKLTAATSVGTVEFKTLKNKLKNEDVKIIKLNSKRLKWASFTGWAAVVLISIGLYVNINEKQNLEIEIQAAENKNKFLENQIEGVKEELISTTYILNAIRSKDVLEVPLEGQGKFASSYAKVYWNKKENKIYLDGQGLPDAPSGKVWQVWSLTLNPLTPKSLGVIKDFNSDKNKIFEINNINKSQAFGITLEPEGGSESPTMDQLYTLGLVTL